MSECIRDTDWAALLEEGERHPQHAHLAGCPRCRARLADFTAFARGAPGSEPERIEAAERVLVGLISERLAGNERPAEITPLRAVAAADAGPRRVRPLRWKLPMLATAAALIAAVGWWALQPGRTPLERGAAGESGSAAGVTLREPASTSEGLVLAWNPVPGADQYEVRFFAPDLGDLARSGPLPKPRFVLRAEHLPTGLTHGRTVLWQVTALAAGERIATSTTRTIRVP